MSLQQGLCMMQHTEGLHVAGIVVAEGLAGVGECEGVALLGSCKGKGVAKSL